jgi:RES domain-containing protein
MSHNRLPPPRRISGTYWRHTSPRRDALDLPAAAPAAARYHRRGEPAPLYLSSDRDACWAELFRHVDAAVVSPFEVMRRMTRVAVTDLPVLDLTDPRAREALALTEAQLVGNEYRHCRRAADLVRRHARRYGGILAPSAAAPDATTLVVEQAWVPNHVRVESHRTQTAPRRLADLFDEVARTLPHRRPPPLA